MANKDKEKKVTVSRVAVRQFRATLRTLSEQGNPVLIGTRWHTRGIYIPVAQRRYDANETRETRDAALLKAFRAALDEMG